MVATRGRSSSRRAYEGHGERPARPDPLDQPRARARLARGAALGHAARLGPAGGSRRAASRRARRRTAGRRGRCGRRTWRWSAGRRGRCGGRACCRSARGRECRVRARRASVRGWAGARCHAAAECDPARERDAAAERATHRRLGGCAGAHAEPYDGVATGLDSLAPRSRPAALVARSRRAHARRSRRARAPRATATDRAGAAAGRGRPTHRAAAGSGRDRAAACGRRGRAAVAAEPARVLVRGWRLVPVRRARRNAPRD